MIVEVFYVYLYCKCLIRAKFHNCRITVSTLSYRVLEVQKAVFEISALNQTISSVMPKFKEKLHLLDFFGHSWRRGIRVCL